MDAMTETVVKSTKPVVNIVSATSPHNVTVQQTQTGLQDSVGKAVCRGAERDGCGPVLLTEGLDGG